MLSGLEKKIEIMKGEALEVETARGDKRNVSDMNREGRDKYDEWKLLRVPMRSRMIIEVEVLRSRELNRRKAGDWLREIAKLPHRLQSKVLHLVYWDYPSKELDAHLTHKVEEVDEFELAYCLYVVGYTATRALARAARSEDY